MDLVIEGLGVAGDGVGRLPDGRVVFVERALPGDRVRVRLAGARKRVLYADLLEVLEPSAERVESLCREMRCGGCALKGMSLQGQARLKRDRVVQTMRRLAGMDVQGILGPEVTVVGDGWAYRHRVRFHATWTDGQGWELGHYERRSHRLVPVTMCPVLWPELQEAVRRVAAAVHGLPADAQLQGVDLAYSRRDGRAAARLEGTGPLQILRRPQQWMHEAGLSGVELQGGDRRWRHGNVELRYDHRAADKYDLLFEPGLFTQAFPEANDALVDAVVTAVRPRDTPRVLELHAGVGNFTIPLARGGARLRAVEQNRRASVLCRRNATSPGLDVEAVHGDDTQAVAALRDADTVDVVVLDPPRTGARGAVELLAKARVARIVYVSCDVATFARDAAILAGGGYRLTAMQAFDLFAQTPHVETVSTFHH